MKRHEAMLADMERAERAYDRALEAATSPGGGEVVAQVLRNGHIQLHGVDGWDRVAIPPDEAAAVYRALAALFEEVTRDGD